MPAMLAAVVAVVGAGLIKLGTNCGIVNPAQFAVAVFVHISFNFACLFISWLNPSSGFD
jgi:hypothetical protein